MLPRRTQPKPDEITLAQKLYIKTFMTAFDVAFNVSFVDGFKVVSEIADLGSAADYFISQELARNVDGFRLSAYMTKDRQSKLYAVAVVGTAAVFPVSISPLLVA